MSNCVNKSSKEFKDCCKRLNISPTTLEPIIHEFINIEGNENSFPSDVYIEERIHGKSMEVLENAQVQLWENRYSQPRVFNTQEEALTYYNECNKYFPKESVGLKETLEGKYEVVIKRPVAVSQNYLETKFQEEETTRLLETLLFNKKEETATKEEIKQGQSNQEVIKGELGVNKQQLISLLGSTMYQSGRQEVAIKEILQNAFDAVKIAKSKGQIEDGKIDIELDTTKRTIKIQDNGIGMTPQIVQKAFFTIGGSYKGDNVDNSLKSGGLGLAKMAFLFGSEYVEVTTIKDGIKTYVRATPEEIQNDNFNIVTSKTTESNGTTVEVKIPENYLDNNGELKSIYFSQMPSFLNKPMIGDVTVNTRIITGWSDNTTSSDKSQIPEGYFSIGKATADFGDVEIYIKPKKTSSDSNYLDYEVLNSGLYQFDNYFKLNQKAQFEVIFNILPKVGVENALYPINNQREGFRSTVGAEIKDLAFLLDKINNVLVRQSVASAFENAISINVKSVAKVTREKAGFEESLKSIRKELETSFKATTSTSNSKSSASPKSTQNVEISLSEVRENKEKEEQEKKRTSSLDTSDIKINEQQIKVNTINLDINKPVFHNNTTLVIEQDGQVFLEELGALLLELKDLYSQTYKDANIITRHNYKQIVDFISQQYWGISFDKNYGGVNVNPSLFNFLGINPFYYVTQYEGVDTALMLTEYITHLIKHEFNHNYASGEGAEFTGRFPATDAEFAGIGPKFLKDWKNKLYTLIKTNLKTVVKYADEYQKARNLGDGFKENKLTISKESSNSGIVNDGTDIQGNTSRENVQNNGGEFDAIIQEFIEEQVRKDKEWKEVQQRDTIEEEKQQIKQKAIANGTFMKAPNGQPTNLTEQQWLQVRTKAFKRWFGDWESQTLLDNVNLFNLTNGFYGKGNNKKDGFIIKDGNLILTPKVYGSGKYTQTRYTHHFTALHPVTGTHEDWDSLDIILITPYKSIRDAVGNEALNVEPMDIYFGSTKNIEIPVKNIKVIVASEETKNRLINKGFLSENIEVDSVWGNLIKEQSKLDRNDILDEDDWNRNHKAIEDRRRELTAKYSISKEEYDRIIRNRGYSSVLEDGDYSKTPYTHTDSWLHRGEINSTYGTYGLDRLADDIRRGEANMHEIIFGYEIITSNKYKDSEEDVKTIIDAYNNLKNYNSVSKVVDENGEPLVVYHHTDNPNLTKFSIDFDNYFSKDGGTKLAIFFDEEKTGTLNRKYDIPVFLNIRNLNEYNETKAQLHERGTTYREIVNQSAKVNPINGGVHMKDFDDNMKEHQSIWIVHNPNQIKSATDNIGTFSTLSDNIYYNLSSKSITKDLKDKGLIHTYNGELYVTKKGIESLEDVENYFIEKMMRLGYSEDSYDLDRTTNGVRVTINEGSRKADYIESEVNHTFSTIENTIKFLEEKIPTLQGKVHYNVTIKEAKEVLGDKYDDNVNSFVHNGEIYLIKGRVTQDIAIEEALHILTESLIEDNLDLAHSLLHEAQKLFPQLVDEIRRTYEGTGNQNREILTQALARIFRQEFNEGERQTAESILSKFINWIKQLFGINPNTGNTIIELEELSTDMTLRDFAQLINSSNAEFRTWSHNKTQFDKSPIPKAKGKMTFSYGDNKREDITSTTTFEAIQKGERTATTRYESDGHIDYWKSLKKGDIIEWESKTGEKVLVRVTKPLHKLQGSGKTAEQWSKLEGWSTKYFNSKVRPRLEEAWQIEYELLENTSFSDKFNLTPDTKLNIWFGSGENDTQRENAHLSNFADRPFTIDFSLNRKIANSIGFVTLYADDVKVPTVEHAFQLAKLSFLPEELLSEEVSRGQKTTIEKLEERILNASAAGAKKLGKTIPLTKDGIELWDKHSSTIMKALIKASFEQNPEALQRLLNTGNVTLTHTQDKGKWNKEFPKLLMEVREELKRGKTDEVSHLQNTKLQEYQQSAEFYSGAADGADQAWAKYLREKGLKVKDFTVKDYDALPQSEKDRIEKDYQNIVQYLGRKAYPASDYRGKLVRRDMLQAEAADAVFAIGTFDSKGWVSGGTAYAVTRAVGEKEVYFYDLNSLQWYIYEDQAGAFWPLNDIPTLTPHAAVIGTRDDVKITHVSKGPERLRKEGHNAIKAVIEKTFNENTETSEENLTQDEIDAKANKETELDAVFQNTLQLTEQLKNTQESGLISTSEFTQLANDVAYYISDLITRWQENPEEFKQSAPTLATEIDVRTLSRRELVEKIGVPKLLEVVKKALFGKRIPGVDARKTLLLFKNFDALIRFGSSAFNTVEDFQISYSEIGYTVSDKTESTENENLSNEENAVIEENGDKQEHWQIDSRTVDTFLTMSQAVKKELARCYKLNSDGTISKNEFGINERISPRDATSCILRWTQGSLTLSNMILKLEGKQENNPWIKPIIEKLRDNSGKYSDFQSQFFGVFCKHFQEYYIVKEFKEGNNKVLRIMPVNRTPALNEIMTSIEVLFKLKAHPMFDNNGLIKEKLDDLKSYVNLLNEISTGNFEELPLDRISKGIAKIADLLGYKTTDEMVILALTPESLYTIKKSLSYIVSNLEKGLCDSNYNPFSFNKENKNGIRNNLKEFLQPLTEVLEDLAISSFFESGKMYQSYVIPSYMTKLMRKFQNSNEQEFKEFMQKEYGQYEWFRDQSRDIEDPNSWKNDWLRQLYFMSNENRKKLFGHKVQLSFVGHNYMRNMTGPEYVMAIMTEFFSGSKDSKETIIPTWYKIPMLSNKPSLEFIKFARYRGIGYEETILDGLQQVFIQELGRIIEVKNRAYSDKDDRHIKNFDTNGQKFCFLDFLNDYLGSKAHTELGILLDKKINSSEQLTIEEENKLFDLVRKEINSFMTKKSNEIIQSYKNSGLFEAVKKIDGIGNTDAEVESNLKNFIWNDTYASMMILQMTITDIAYYANAEDLQKRLAQIHAPGIRPNVEAMDYGEYDDSGRLIKKAERVCDGNLRTIFLKDFEGDVVVQNVIENLEVVFSRKENEAKTDAEKEYWKNTKEAIIDAFKDVNVTDAQAYNSITSYRKKAIMFGKWSSKNEEIYKKLKDGKWNIFDLETIFQPLKPFVYTNSTKESVGSKLKVGMQFKNAEYALLIADAILRNEDTGKPNLLKVLSEIMEESADRTNKRDKGIDTIMFASAVKAGLHGRLDIANFKDEKAAKDYLESKIYGDGADGYNETYVHTFPAEDYSIQQDYSPHFLEHSQADGSQKRMIIPSDLATVDADDNPVLYSFKDGDEIKSLTAKEFKKEYEETYAENIENSLNELEFELGLNLPTKKLRNIALSQVLQKEILSSPRYGIDLYIACSVDSEGNFNIPLGDPIQSKRIEQLINSIVKNRLNKQKIKGGPVIQVSNFGSTRLNIKFKDKKGNILPTLTEWLEKNPGKTAEDFKKFLEENQAGVAYYECYAPAYMQEMFEDFMDERGFIDWEAINELEPEMLDMIGFRIPTEDLYSIAPMKIMGFLPKEAGEVIMMPYEVTVVWGSDKHHCFYPTK